ncbi:DUF4268 domain-containing protein [Flavobacterium sp.]|jgi:hypothetical protein|uniref:DUF4268 domain-containing protein n=1 Tax=Flavobacterium sp. TaxID=239 RepID=UPI002A837216|nr:DUF4268 domain-containing protein [Flavobacterium sp.]
MFSKEEAQRLKKEFWTAFAASNSRKWILYNTKIKDVTFKFYVDNKKAQVLLDIEPKNDKNRIVYYEKVESLKDLLLENHLPDAIFEREFHLSTGKVISRVWVEKTGLSMNNKEHWPEIFEFFSEKMEAFEYFFFEHEEYIKDLEINT